MLSLMYVHVYYTSVVRFILVKFRMMRVGAVLVLPVYKYYTKSTSLLLHLRIIFIVLIIIPVSISIPISIVIISISTFPSR